MIIHVTDLDRLKWDVNDKLWVYFEIQLDSITNQKRATKYVSDKIMINCDPLSPSELMMVLYILKNLGYIIGSQLKRLKKEYYFDDTKKYITILQQDEVYIIKHGIVTRVLNNSKNIHSTLSLSAVDFISYNRKHNIKTSQ